MRVGSHTAGDGLELLVHFPSVGVPGTPLLIHFLQCWDGAPGLVHVRYTGCKLYEPLSLLDLCTEQVTPGGSDPSQVCFYITAGEKLTTETEAKRLRGRTSIFQ